jgi:endonuclease IV
MFGIHIAKTSKISGKKCKSMLDAIKNETHNIGLDACQIFTHGPRSFKLNKIDEGIKEYCEEEKISISVHSPYPATSIWSITKKDKNSEKSRKLINFVIESLTTSDNLGSFGVVFHLPNKSPEVVKETMEVLAEHIRDFKSKFILEMPASKPSETTYETPEKLNKLCSEIKHIPNWCLCIDTSHQFSCGVNFADGWHSWISELSEFTKSKISMLHLNGNSTKHFNTGKDVHEIILSPEDGIWGNIITPETMEFIESGNIELSEEDKQNIINSSLFEIIRYAKKNNIITIMEINRGELIHAQLAIKVIKFIQSH